MRSLSFVLVLAAAAAASGCAVVTSQRSGIAGNTGPAPAGIPYMLPKALVPVEVVASGGSIRIDALEPIFVGDPNEAYILSYNGSAFAKDVVSIEVDPKTSLLKNVVVERKDETGEVLKKLIASVVRAESATGAEQTVIYQGVIDPDDDTTAAQFSAGANASIAAYLRPSADCAGECASAKKIVADEVALAGAAGAAATVKRLTPKITAATNAPLADCSAGICHRASVPYVVELKLLKVSRQTVVMLPNGAPPVALALDGKPFVTVKHTVALRNGVVEKYDVDKPSSALALVSWPLDVYDAIVTTTAKILQLKIDTSRNATALEEQRVGDAEKLKALQDRLDALNKPKPESASLVDIGSPGRILSVGRGTAASALPTAVQAKKDTEKTGGGEQGGAAVPVKSGGGTKTLPASDGSGTPAGK